MTGMINCIPLSGSGLQLWSVYSGSLNSTPLRGNTSETLVSFNNNAVMLLFLYFTFTALLLFTISCLACSYVISTKKCTEFYLLSP